MAKVLPLGCCLLMLLLLCGELMGDCEKLQLHLQELHTAWDGHRLLTHVLCTPDVRLFFLSLLVFLLCIQMESYMGTLSYLHLSCICTLCCSILYIFLSWLLPSSAGPAYGYLATQLALLMVHCPVVPYRLDKRLAPFFPCGILIISQLLCPLSPLLLNICGILSGLIIRSDLLSCLELSKHRRVALERIHLFRFLASTPFVQFIPTRSKGALLPETDPRPRDRPMIYEDINFAFDTNEPSVGISNQALSFVGDKGPSVTPMFENPKELDDELLKAGIEASLRDYEEQEIMKQELSLHKSCVSALRLQQLEKMGFPTGPAVVALAAAGKVERAVSLLVEGQVGEEILVASDRR
ncbi:rhomboid domain-containing protein 3 [Bombina bombina]|uniref:rhomboid domain-containing protein 3 n=1 Tax=Bombina bombina TaxID=8345 RepID=UPI00235B11B7|nr:rhomboid domain-containing protein 3 [Bombina bombina]XP_053558152.1 rhomboid domain-containing protein 3 [Bombina bombina]